MEQETPTEWYEMTDVQKDIWEMVNALPGTPIAHNGGYLEIAPGLTADQCLEITLDMVRRNPALRLCLAEDGKLYVAREVSGVCYTDYDAGEEYWVERGGKKTLLAAVRAGKEFGFADFEAEMERRFRAPRQLYGKPLCEMQILKFKNVPYVLGMFHHLAMDNIGIFQVGATYLAKGCPEGEDGRFLEIMKKKQEIGKYGARLIDSWKGRKIDWKLRERASDGKSRQYGYDLPKEISDKILQTAKEQGLSVDAMACAAISVYIAKVKGVKGVAVGKHLTNRTKKQMDVMGMMVNTLPAYVELDWDEPFFELCRRVGRENYDLMRCGGLSLGRLRREAGIEEMPFDVCVSYRSSRYLTLEGFPGGRELSNGYNETPLRIFVNEGREGIELIFDAQEACYGPEEIDGLYRRLSHIFLQAADNPSVGSMEILAPEERLRIRECNDTGKWEFRRSIWDSFRVWARERADCVFWADEKGGALTFAQTESAVCRMAAFLEERGVTEGSMVGLVLERDCLLPVAMMAVCKAGGAFLPIGFSEPEETVRGLAAYCSHLVSSRELGTPQIRVSLEMFCGEAGGESSAAEAGGEASAAEAGGEASAPGADAWKHRPDAPIYGIFTSGSTGSPKIAVVTERSLTCRLEWMKERFGMEGRLLQKTVNTFDVSVWELLLPFLCGNRAFLLAEGEEKFPDAIVSAAVKNRIEIIHFVPSMLAAVLRYLEMEQSAKLLARLRRSLKMIFCSGEPLSAELAERAGRAFPAAMVVNLYGPAECTIDVSCHVCRPGEAQIPIGKPVYNTKLYVCGKDGEEMPPGEEGELVVAGDLVGDGYLGGGAEQARRFFTEGGERRYRTGDIVKRLPDGEILYLRREGQETKVRGIRVDLEEIARLMRGEPEASDACALVHGHMLYAFYESGREITDWETRLKGKLPRQSMPGRFIRLDTFPVQANGKLDRRALERFLRGDLRERAAGRGKAAGRVRAAVEKYFPGKRLRDDEDFFRAGLDSLTAACIISDLIEAGFQLQYKDLYRHPTIRSLEQYLEGAGSRAGEEGAGSRAGEEGAGSRAEEAAGGSKDEEASENRVDEEASGNCAGEEASGNRREEGGEAPEYLLYIGRDGRLAPGRQSDHILLCVPYAGGGFSQFTRLARSLWRSGIQVCVADLDAFGEMGVLETARRLAALAREIPRLSILGCCVGSAQAVALAGLLEQAGNPARRLYLCGALPYTCGKDGKVLWDLIGPEGTERFFSFLHGKKVSVGKQEHGRVLRDARKSAIFFRDGGGALPRRTAACLIYGERDALTAGFLLRKRRWGRWLGNVPDVCKIDGAGHFFVKTHARAVAKIVLEREERVTGQP